MSNPLDSFFPFLWKPGEDEEWLSRMEKADVLAIDFETAGRGGKKLAALDMRTLYAVGMSVAWREGSQVISVYLPLRHELSKLNHPDPQSIISRVANGPQSMRVFHQARFDVGVIRVEGAEPKWPWSDTMIMSWLYDENVGKKLKSLGEHYLGWKPLEYSSFNNLPFGVIPPDIAFRYACQDAHLTLLLYEFFRENFDIYQSQLYDKLEMDVSRILIDMEYSGIPIDLKLLHKYKALAQSKIGQLEDEISEAFQIKNPNSAQQIIKGCGERGVQLASTAADKLQMFLETSAGDIPSDVYSALSHLRAYRFIRNKILGYYISSVNESLFPDNCIHPQFHQWYVSESDARLHGTVTGRFSTTSPSLQTWPKEKDASDDYLAEILPNLSVRRLTYSGHPDYVFVCGDLSQVEVRVAASVAKEEKLINVFKDGSEDVHKLIGSYILGKDPSLLTDAERQLGKKVVFTSLYFGGVNKIASAIWPYALKILYTSNGRPVPDEATAKREVANLARRVRGQFYSAFPAFKQYPERVKQLLLTNKEVRTRLGRSRRFPYFDVNDHRMIRQAGNFLIQSQAVDICKLAMVSLSNKIQSQGWDARMVGQIHDEVILIAHRDDAANVARALYDSFKEQEWVLDPVVGLDSDVKVGYSWGDLKAFDFDTQNLDDVCPRPNSNDFNGAEVKAKMEAIIREAVSCTKCPLFEAFGWKKVFYEGKVTEPIDIVIVGGNPRYGDMVKRQVFSGDSGAILQDELRRAGLTPSNGVNMLYAPAVLCWSQTSQGIAIKEISQCASSFLDRVLAIVQPKVVLCLGSMASRAVMKTNKTELKIGWATTNNPFRVYITHHPSFIYASRGYMLEWRQQLQEVSSYLQQEVSLCGVS